MSKTGERRDRRRRQDLARLLKGDPDRFVKVWNKYLAGWTDQIVSKARDAQRAQEATQDSLALERSDISPVKESPAEYAAASFLATADRWLADLGTEAEKLVGKATRDLLVHECCKLIAAETDKRLFDLVQSRLYALIKRGAPKPRHGEGQRRAARERQRTKQAFAAPVDVSAWAPPRPSLRTDAPNQEHRPVAPLPPAGLPGAGFEALRVASKQRPRVLVLDMHHDRAPLLRKWFEPRRVEVIWGALDAVTGNGIGRVPLRLILIDPSILDFAGSRGRPDALQAFAYAVSNSRLNKETQIILWAIDDIECAGIADPLKAAGLSVFREPFRLWNATHAAGWLMETRR